MPTWLLNKWVIAAVVVGVLGSALWIQTLRLDAAKKAEAAAVLVGKQWKSNFESMEATNAANVRAIERLQAEQKRANEVAAAERDKYNRLGSAYEKLKKSTDTTALSDSWRDVFGGLRDIERGAVGRDQN